MEEYTDALANCDKGAATAETEAAEATEQAADTTESQVSESEVGKEEAPAKATQEQAEVDFTKIELPEGFTMNEAALKEFMPLAKELGMNQEQAQAALSLHAKVMGETVKAWETNRETAYTELMADVKADKVMGGDKYEENLGKINAFFGESADIFHAAVAQIAGFDKAKARQLYAAIDAKAKEYQPDSHLVGGKQAGSDIPVKNILFTESLKNL